MTTPNLFALFTEYHVDLSAADSTLNIPLKDLILTYQRASASALRISIVPKNTAAVYTNSQETHNMRIRQQDPVTKL